MGGRGRCGLFFFQYLGLAIRGSGGHFFISHWVISSLGHFLIAALGFIFMPWMCSKNLLVVSVVGGTVYGFQSLGVSSESQWSGLISSCRADFDA